MPRTYITAERTLLAGHYNVYSRVEVQDSDGTWRDLTAYTGGRNFFSSATWSRTLDAPVMTGTVTFLRSVLGASLAPQVASIMNTNAASAFSPLLAGGRGLRISTNCTTVGVAPVSGDWREVFLGRIDDPDWGGDDGTITVTISSLDAWLMGKQIDTARQYGSSGGTAVETVMQSILTDNPSAILGTVTLYTPTSPGWNIRTYTQAKGSLLGALRALAQQIGWDVRYQYDASNVFRLTFFQPPRSKTVADYSLTAAEYYAIPELNQALADVRTRIGGSYVDHATGSRLTRYIQSDATHTNQYDVVYMEIAEDASSNIDTAAEMDTMLNAALSDLQDPAATMRVENSYFWLAELGDLIGYPANNVQFDGTQNLAVTGIVHTLDASGETTALTCRGKVAGSVRAWHRIQTTDDTSAPSLDVVATPGTSAYSIAYTAPSEAVELSISGGAYSPAPASPISVTRPSAGGTPLEYTFRVVLNGQTITDTVTIQPIDANTVTPDLVVTQYALADTYIDYLLSGSNPAGGTAPTFDARVNNSTGLADAAGGAPTAMADGQLVSVLSGQVVRVFRAAFGTTAQPMVTFRATIAGGGVETIQRSVANQVKTTFGPSLDVQPGPGATSYSIAYVGSGGTVQLSINGAAYSAAPASPITVTRPGVGGTPLEYAFRIVADGQTVTDAVTVQPVDKDTVSPDLVVSLSSQQSDRVVYIVSATNPDGSALPITVTVSPVGCTASWGPTTGLENSVADGATGTLSSSGGLYVDVFRPVFGTTAQASVTFRASRSGGAPETIQRSVANQVKTSFGPSLVVTPTPGSSSYSLAYSGTYDTLVLSIDGAAYGAPAASPITVTRGSASHTYSFKATKDGVDVVQTVTVPALEPGTFSTIAVSVNSYSTNTMLATWSWGGASSATFDVYVQDGGGAFYLAASGLAAGTTSTTFAVAENIDAAGTATVVIRAYVVASSGTTVLGTSAVASNSPKYIP